MILLALALVRAQAFPTISPIVTPTPASVSERALLDSGLGDAAARAKAIGGSLGVEIVDLTTGADAQRSASSAYPMAGLQRLPLAILVYRSVDAGSFSLAKNPAGSDATVAELLARMLLHEDAAAQRTLIGALGGTDAVDAQLRALGYDTIFFSPDGTGFAPPEALARLLSNLAQGKLLRPPSTKSLVDQLVKVQSAPQRLRAGLIPNARLAHQTGTLPGPGGVAQATNDAGIAYIEGHTVVIVAMLKSAGGGDSNRDAVIADVGRTVVTAINAAP